ncbi:hypothetical protein GA0061074_1245 [Weissella bombi]|uniref:Uncharacterized protein n=1 Tax=Weissella bombi TaxID=1505725 RepID=A0A1C4C6J7_9LACO|nr:hypothetical protein GA0061074_1245 [Weissella bombi]
MDIHSIITFHGLRHTYLSYLITFAKMDAQLLNTAVVQLHYLLIHIALNMLLKMKVKLH